MAFNFGSTANKPLFGSTAPSTFGTLGTTTTTASTGFGGFGTTTGTGTSTAFNFGSNPTSTTSSGFGGGFNIGGTQSNTSTTGTTGSSLFSGGSTGFNFGGAATSSTTTNTGFNLGGTSGGLGGGLGGGGLLGNTTGNANQQNTEAQNLQMLSAAVRNPNIFGDERDAVILRWNQLQSQWGTGKGFFNRQGNSVEFGDSNPFCMFQAVGYSFLPTSKNKEGLVAILFAKELKEVQKIQQQLVDALTKLLGNKPSLSVCVEGVKSLPDNKTEMIVYVQERANDGTTRRIPASELSAFLNQNNIKTQMTTQMAVANVLPKIGFTRDQLKQYLDKPPSGVDYRLWQQAKIDNPDPEKLIPVPMVGFSELKRRLELQEQQTNAHQTCLEGITDDISNLQRNQTNMAGRIEQYKRKYLELSHRVLQVMAKQEIYRKQGYAIQVEEEQLKVQLEAIQAELNAPTQFKGRLNELISQIRMQNHLACVKADATYQMDNTLQEELQQHLKQQQEGLKHLISIIKNDLDDLKVIEQELSDGHELRR